MHQPSQPQTPSLCFRSIVVVGFDLNEGQVISHVHPPYNLPDAFLKNLASIAFPDTSSFSDQGELFYFLKLNNGEESLFCYIIFSQRKDPTNKRGYSQISTIIVSPIRAVTVFHVLLSKINSIFHLSNHQTSLLDDFYQDLVTLNPCLTELLQHESFSLNCFKSQIKVIIKRVHSFSRRISG